MKWAKIPQTISLKVRRSFLSYVYKVHPILKDATNGP